VVSVLGALDGDWGVVVAGGCLQLLGGIVGPDRVQSFLNSRKMRVGSFSEWFLVLSGVPQELVLGLLLLLLFVNKLPLWIVNSMSMFADDTKLWAYIRSEADSKSLQKDLDMLVEWSNEWQQD